MRHKTELPPNYEKLIQFCIMDLGTTFTDRADNISELARHMGWQTSQVRAVLGILSHNGILRWSRNQRTWTIVKADTEAA